MPTSWSGTGLASWTWLAQTLLGLRAVGVPDGSEGVFGECSRLRSDDSEARIESDRDRTDFIDERA
jgi:hypothetical protein